MPHKALAASLLILTIACLSSADDWPMYRHDARRSGSTEERMTAPLSEAWVFTGIHPPEHAWADPQPKPIEDKLELPRMRFDDAFHVAVAGNSVYFGSSAENKVYCLDAGNGRIRWQFFTDGPVRLAPTVWKGKLYVGSDDGHVYCLHAGSGSLAWKFSAAPSPRKLLGNGKMISLWPVRTGVLVADGVAYFGAGVFPAQGLYLYAVDADSGKLVWKNDSYGRGGLGTVSPQGYLLRWKSRLFVPSGRTMPAAFSRDSGEFLFHENPSWRQMGLFGGSYCVILGDILLNGTEQLMGISASNGNLLFVEGLPLSEPSKGTRRVAAAKDATYILDGENLTAVKFRPWSSARSQISRSRARIADLRNRLDRIDRKVPEELSRQADPAELQRRMETERVEVHKFQKRAEEAMLWRRHCRCSDSLVASDGLVFAGGDGIVRGFDPSSGRELWSARTDGKARGLAIARGKLFVSTDRGSIHCFANGSRSSSRRVTPQVDAMPYRDDDRLARAANDAEKIVTEARVDRGFALILGAGQGRLPFQLAKRTELEILAIDGNADNVSAARRALSEAGLYGSRVVVEQARAHRLPYSDYFANLIVCRTPQDKPIPIEAPELLRMLKPCGGVALIGPLPETGQLPNQLARWSSQMQAALARLGETETKVELTPCWLKITRGKLTGAGTWTHQYANAANTAGGDDTHVRGPIDILWYGEPGPGRMPSRHSSNVSPLAAGGRMFIQAENVVMAYDAYNGMELWSREIVGAVRLDLKVRCSNIAVNHDSVFVAVDDHCLRLDAATGRTVSRYHLPWLAEGAQHFEWDYLACTDRMLFGSNGEDIFAYDISDSNEPRWTHSAGDLIPRTIAMGDGKIFYIDRQTTDAQRNQAMVGVTHEASINRRGEPVGPDIRLVVALEAKTGQRLWEKPQYVSDCVYIGPGGGDLTVMYANGVVLLCGQPWNGHFWTEFLAGEFSRRSLIALSAEDGRELWSGKKGYRSRPIIIGNEIFAEPWRYDLMTGAAKKRLHPVTGFEGRWQMSRPGHHCGNIAGSPNALFFRSGTTAFYDLVGDCGTAHFGAQRPGCWINCIPANGVVMMPEASSGCVCPFSLHCTIVLAPCETNRVWGVFSADGPMTPVRHLAINLGAPGDRRDSSGKLWLAHPRPFKSRLVIDPDITSRRGRTYAVNPEFSNISETEEPWLYTFGMEGMKWISVPLADRDAPDKHYTVRLHFAELAGAQPGQRVFDVSVQGKTVLENFDIAKEAGGADRAIAKEFGGILADKELLIGFNAAKGKPLLAAIEVILHKNELATTARSD